MGNWIQIILQVSFHISWAANILILLFWTLHSPWTVNPGLSAVPDVHWGKGSRFLPQISHCSQPPLPKANNKNKNQFTAAFEDSEYSPGSLPCIPSRLLRSGSTPGYPSCQSRRWATEGKTNQLDHNLTCFFPPQWPSDETLKTIFWI